MSDKPSIAEQVAEKCGGFVVGYLAAIVKWHDDDKLELTVGDSHVALCVDDGEDWVDVPLTSADVDRLIAALTAWRELTQPQGDPR